MSKEKSANFPQIFYSMKLECPICYVTLSIDMHDSPDFDWGEVPELIEKYQFALVCNSCATRAEHSIIKEGMED